jgi:predicted transposase/invertase (TIGR01784 family)
MIFLDPTSDPVFKKLFGNITHRNIIISFLNNLLGRTQEDKIVEVTFNDASNIPETVDLKYSIVDIRCTDQRGHEYIVEMQVVKQLDYAERCQYYSALALSRQLKKGQKYHTLLPVIFVGILSFDLDDSPDYVNHHVILNRATHHRTLKHLEFHFVELTKFNKTIEASKSLLDQFIYMLKHATEMNTIPAGFKKNPDVVDAFDLLEQGNWSKTELEAYDKYLDIERSSASQLDTARIDGELKGKLEAKRAIAQQLIGKLDEEIIAQSTGLTIQEIEELKKNK